MNLIEKWERMLVEPYEAPTIEVSQIVIEQHILNAGSDVNTNNLDTIEGEYW